VYVHSTRFVFSAPRLLPQSSHRLDFLHHTSGLTLGVAVTETRGGTGGL